jgi:hypothetical protein
VGFATRDQHRYRQSERLRLVGFTDSGGYQPPCSSPRWPRALHHLLRELVADGPVRDLGKQSPATDLLPKAASDENARRCHGVLVEARRNVCTCSRGTPGPSGPSRCDQTTVGRSVRELNATAGTRARSSRDTCSSPP